MRFFTAACVCCLLVATFGCVTNNWSSSPFSKSDSNHVKTDAEETWKSFWNSNFGELSGSDARTREIERRLGY